MCNENNKCNYIFWNSGEFSSTGMWCTLYEDCNEYTTSKAVGTVFAKKGHGLHCPGKTAQYNICNSVMH